MLCCDRFHREASNKFLTFPQAIIVFIRSAHWCCSIVNSSRDVWALVNHFDSGEMYSYLSKYTTFPFIENKGKVTIATKYLTSRQLIIFQPTLQFKVTYCTFNTRAILLCNLCLVLIVQPSMKHTKDFSLHILDSVFCKIFMWSYLLWF